MGHEAPFAMELCHRPVIPTEGLPVGTPPIVQLSILDTALDAWEGVDMADLRAATITLSETFITQVATRCPQLTLASPPEAELRGSQVSIAFEPGYATMQALIDRGVIGDFRASNFMRFGFSPLHPDTVDVRAAVDILECVMHNGLRRDPKFRSKSRVT